MKDKINASLSLILNIIFMIVIWMGIIGGVAMYLTVMYLSYYDQDILVKLGTVSSCDNPSWIGEGSQCMTDEGYKPCRILACISEN